MSAVKIIFRGKTAEVKGYIEPADRDVGIMGESFCPEDLIFEDGTSFDDWESVTDEEFKAIDNAFWAAERMQNPEPPDPLDEDGFDFIYPDEEFKE